MGDYSPESPLGMQSVQPRGDIYVHQDEKKISEKIKLNENVIRDELWGQITNNQQMIYNIQGSRNKQNHWYVYKKNIVGRYYCFKILIK